MKRCKTCIHWIANERAWDDIERPIDPDTCEPMELTFEVRQCQHPDLLFCERPLQPEGFAVADGSQYYAAFYTGEEYGCVLHVEESE